MNTRRLPWLAFFFLTSTLVLAAEPKTLDAEWK